MKTIKMSALPVSIEHNGEIYYRNDAITLGAKINSTSNHIIASTLKKEGRKAIIVQFDNEKTYYVTYVATAPVIFDESDLHISKRVSGLTVAELLTALKSIPHVSLSGRETEIELRQILQLNVNDGDYKFPVYSYYADELSKLGMHKFGAEAKIKLTSNDDASTKWLNLNDESANALVAFLAANFNIDTPQPVEREDIQKILDIDAAQVSNELLNVLLGECTYRDTEPGLNEDIYSIDDCDNLDMVNDAIMDEYKGIVAKCASADCGYFRIINFS